MKKRLLGLLICGILVLGMTGCGNDKTTTDDNNQEETSKNEETKKLKVGDYEIKYGFYKSEQVNVVKIMEDGKCTWNAVDYLCRVEDNYVILYELQGEDKIEVDRLSLRVENETTLKIESKSGSDIDTLYYYEVD